MKGNMQRGNTHAIWAVKGGRELPLLSPVRQETAVHEEMSKQLPNALFLNLVLVSSWHLPSPSERFVFGQLSLV